MEATPKPLSKLEARIEELQRLEKKALNRANQIKRQRTKLLERSTAADRKLETRQKIIAGAALLKAVADGDKDALHFWDRAKSQMISRSQDREAFGWLEPVRESQKKKTTSERHLSDAGA